MKVYQVLVGGLLPYVAVLAFVGGMAYRVRVWVKTPQPGKMTLFPLREGSTVKNVLMEAFLFPGLFRSDKVLWTFSWIFHATLALVLVGHARVFTGIADRMLLALGLSPAAIDTVSAVTGGTAGIVLLATGALLLIRRVGIPRVREVSLPADFAALLLVLAIIVTGNAMRFGAHFDLQQTRAWTVSLLRFSPEVPADAAFLLHVLLAQVLLIFIPFSKILHFGGIFFTQALVRGR